MITCRLLPCLLLILGPYFPCAPVNHVTASRDQQRVLFVLLDGARFDYLSQPTVTLPGFQRLVREGVRAGGLVPEFPSLSYPNYYSLMTGRHTESHGMTANFMFDYVSQEYFNIGMNPEQNNSRWWDHAEPLWITAEKQNKPAYLFYWPGCEVEIRGHKPTFCERYAGVPSLDDFRSAINRSLSLLQSGDAYFAVVYYELTDKLGHTHGPLSPELNDALRDLDPVVNDLVAQLSMPAMSGVNLIVASDHGMTDIRPDGVIDLQTVLNSSDYLTMLYGGAVTNIYTTPDQEQRTYEKVSQFHPHLTVYRKEDLPDRWHYKHGPFVAPLTAVADPGWYAVTEHVVGVGKGTHGYDNANTEMRGIFLAMGPAFQSNQSVDSLNLVDVYPVMCHILGISPRPHNGSLDDVAPLMSPVTAAASSLFVPFTTLVTYRVLLVIATASVVVMLSGMQ